MKSFSPVPDDVDDLAVLEVLDEVRNSQHVSGMSCSESSVLTG